MAEDISVLGFVGLVCITSSISNKLLWLMGRFSVKVIHDDGRPAKDIGVLIDYGLIGTDKKRTDRNGWVTFDNPGNRNGHLWVDGHNMGSHSLADGKTYSFTV
jgi:hypothetical protein